jgi:Cdc6-like AAA superfamily ATPase
MWEGRQIEVGVFTSRTQQVAVRGSLVVAPAVGKILVIDASIGEVVREINLPGARDALPLGVVLDGDFAVFATRDGYLSKLGLDGTYAWTTANVGAVAPPLVMDIDADGLNDVVTVSANQLTGWNGVNGSPVKRSTVASCIEPRVQLGPNGVPGIVIDCGEKARAVYRFDQGETNVRLEGAQGDLVVGEFGGLELIHFQPASALTGVEWLYPERTTSSAPIDWKSVSTMSADDIDGDGFWDLLVVQDRFLSAYKTSTAGRLFQPMPFDGHGFTPSFDTYLKAGRGDDAERFRPAPVTAVEGFTEIPAARIVGLFPTTWPTSELKTPIEQRPLLRDLQTNAQGSYAHDRTQLFVRRKPNGSLENEVAYERLELPASTDSKLRPITALAVSESHVVIAYPDGLVVCNAEGKKCQKKSSPSRRRIRAIVSAPTDSMFWVGTSDAMIISYDAARYQFGREVNAAEIERVDMLARVNNSIVVSGSKGSRIYSASGRDSLTALGSSDATLDQVVQCNSRGSFYARSGGVMLETARLTSQFERVKDQPSAIRELRCDESGALVVLSAASGVWAVQGPMASGIPAALVMVVCCLAVLLFVVRLSYRHAPIGEASRDTPEIVRLGIRTDLPLTRLPKNTDSRLTGLVAALARFIDNADTQPPITIGVYGPWGSGKSSAMRLVQKELETTRRYISVWFNPWRFHREKDIAAALLQSVVQEVRDRAGLARINIALQRLLEAPALLKLSWFVPLVLISFHMFRYPQMWPERLSLIGKELLPTGFAGGSLLTISTFAGLVRFGLAARKVFELNPADLLGQASQEKRVDFIRHFSEELAQVLDALPRGQQVVIFIDDLDRCPPDQTLAMLEALQLLTESQRCYFVLGMDQSMVRTAIELKYKDLLDLKQKQGEDTTGFGAHYLEKIITLAVHVPRIHAAEIEASPTRRDEVPETPSVTASAPPNETQGPRWLSPGRAFFLGWLLLCVFGFAFLFAVSEPALPSAASRETGISASTKPIVVQAKPVPSPSPDPVVHHENTPIPDNVSLVATAREVSRPVPPVPSSQSTAVASHPADHAYQTSFNELLGVVLVDWALCTVLLAVAGVLYYRLRSIQPVGSTAKDSQEFIAALQAYLGHLPRNPRKLIRSGNIARFMYYLAGGERAGSPAAFFACLLAEQQLRPLVGESVRASMLAVLVVNRASIPDSEDVPAEARTRVERIYEAWKQDHVEPFESSELTLDDEFCDEVRSWLRGTAAA